MSFLPSKEQVKRWKDNPIEFLHHIRQIGGFKTTPFQDNIMQRYFRGEPMETLLPSQSQLKRVDVVLQPRKGWSLMALFVEYVFQNYSVPGDEDLCRRKGWEIPESYELEGACELIEIDSPAPQDVLSDSANEHVEFLPEVSDDIRS